MKVSTIQRLGFSVAVMAASMTGCPLSNEDPGTTLGLSSNAGTPAELSVADQSGFLVTARADTQPESGDDIQVEAVPGTGNELKLSWTSSPCQETPRLTIDGTSLNNLQLILDAGPLVPDGAECPDIGVGFSVILEFEGEVSVNEVTPRRVGR